MRINALHIQRSTARPAYQCGQVAPGLNVFHGPSASGKTALADLLAHTLYGRRLAATGESISAPDGEVQVEGTGKSYRLRRSFDSAAGERLTVAAIGQSSVDAESVRTLVGCLPPVITRPLYAVGFDESPRLEWLLSGEFSQEFRAALWRLKWAPPSVESELRPIYARLRALETQLTSLVEELSCQKNLAVAETKSHARTRRRRASYFLSQLTGGELVGLKLDSHQDGAHVVTGGGEVVQVESLWSTQRDQVYLSLCFALVAAVARHGVRLPMLLDEPFTRLDARGAAALTETLDAFSRRGHQVLVFTGNREAVERFSVLGASLHDLQFSRKPQDGSGETSETQEIEPEIRTLRRRVKRLRPRHREAG